MAVTHDGEGRGDKAVAFPGLQQSPRGLFVAMFWFGLLAGWLELGLVLCQGVIDKRISMDMLRRNRHYVWMIPVSNVLIFVALGSLLLVLTHLRPRLARWLAWRVSIALVALALFLTIDGLYLVACLCLSCGVAAVAAPVIERRAGRFHLCFRLTLPVMACGVVVLSAFWSARVTSAERRSLADLPPATPGAPNVLMIVLDDVRAASLSLYGYDRPTTPNLERLARQGVLFSQARATASWTLPSHASMFTGRWPHELSVGWDLPLDATHPTLAELLAGRGYATAGFVANTYYCNALYGLGRGFARFEDNYENETVSLFEVVRSSGAGKCLLQALGYSVRVAEGGTSLRKSAAMLNRDFLGWLDGRPRGRPFFAFLNYYDAHGPFIPPEGPDPRFGLGALPNREQVEIIKKYHKMRAGKLEPGEGPPDRLEREATAVLRDSYESCIASLDRHIGLLFDELEGRGLIDNTLVVVTSDHGEHFNEHGFFGHGLSLYRHETHVPLLILPPSPRQAGRVVTDPVSLRDLPATCVDLLGLADSSPFPGQSLAPFWRPGAAQGRPASPVLSEVDHQKRLPPMPNVPASLGPVKSLVDQGKVYIVTGDGREEIYDLNSDPMESQNLINEPAFRTSAGHLRKSLNRLLEIRSARPPVPTAHGAALAGRVTDE